MRHELLDIEQVEQMLDVFHAIEMAVDVQIAIGNGVGNALRRRLHRLNLSRLLNRTGARINVWAQCLDIQQGRPTTLHIDRRPNGTGIAEGVSLLIRQFKTTAREKTSHLINPSI